MLLALEMSLFARELSKAGHSARSSRLDGCAVAREVLRIAFLPQLLPPRLR